MTLRLRLILGLAAVAVLLTAPLALALDALGRAKDAASALRTDEVAASLLLSRMHGVVGDLRHADLAIVTVPDDPGGARALSDNTATLQALADSVRRFKLDALTAQMTRSATVLATDGVAEGAAAARNDIPTLERISSQRVVPAINSLESALSAANDQIAARAQRRASEAEEATRVAQLQAVMLLGAAAAGALAVSVWLTRSISGGVRALERGFTAVAGGQFDHVLVGVRPSERDEFGRLAGSFEQMAAKLSELDKLKSAFVSVASHELKTPINVILGYLTLLNDEIYGPVAESQRDVLATIERQARTLSRLVQHLLDVSRFEAGVARLELRPVALRAILHEAEQSHTVLAQQRDVTFRTAFAAGLPDVVTWDADRVREVLDNLLSNAVKFTPAGGTVELDAAPDRRRSPPSIRIAVRDTGIGIPADQIPRVFDKFYQADNQNGAAAKGTGLGLAIAKEIVEAHGGFISVESTPGLRTEFLVTLPITAHDGTTLVAADHDVSETEPDDATGAAPLAATSP